MKIIVVSGGFDPIHSGHIAYFSSASKLGDQLIVALNSDEWLSKKKGKPFMNFSERKSIIESLAMVDKVIDFEDDEEGSCILALEKVKRLYPEDKIIFCNGGDRNKKNIPEMKVQGIDFEFSVGGDDKLNSSSWILKEYQFPSEERVWGKFYNLFEQANVKVKELIVSPRGGMSYQKHHKRSEIWLVSEGRCTINHSEKDDDKYQIGEFIGLMKLNLNGSKKFTSSLIFIII